MELIDTAYLILSNIKNGDDIFGVDQLVRSLYTIQVNVLLFAPAICAGFLSVEAEKLKLILYEKLIFERDEDHASILQQFAEYVSSRPLRLRMLKVVPLDWNLPIRVLDLVISYQIVIVQFTHLY
ncbi:hypothetical protein evm_008297 [Chilo suppressalis]|nr:hypothetical protein evm_008297 [Chilo suppressalis]